MTSKDSDKPSYVPSLISVFDVHKAIKCLNCLQFLSFKAGPDS